MIFAAVPRKWEDVQGSLPRLSSYGVEIVVGPVVHIAHAAHATHTARGPARRSTVAAGLRRRSGDRSPRW